MRLFEKWKQKKTNTKAHGKYTFNGQWRWLSWEKCPLWPAVRSLEPVETRRSSVCL